MGFGILLQNGASHKQFDENYSSYRLWASGVGTTGTWVSYPDVGMHGCIVLIRPLTMGVWLGAEYGFANRTRFRVNRYNTPSNAAGFWQTSLGANVQFKYQVYVACADFPTAPSGFGLRILNAAGVPILDSTLSPMRLDANVSIQSMNSGSDIDLGLSGSSFERYFNVNAIGVCSDDTNMEQTFGGILQMADNNTFHYKYAQIGIGTSVGYYFRSQEPLLIGGS